jgi:endo-1,4-beta-D-glucanase Y
MTWQTNRCGAGIASTSATDGDLDAAMALIQAGCRWGASYKTDGITLINALAAHAVAACAGQTILKPGDTFGGCDRTNPSYFAPAYYKVFEAVTGDATWRNLANDSYTLLANVQAKMNGLVPNWTNSSGAIPAGDDGTYGFDASRTPWRIATDYVWYGEPRAVTFLDHVSQYVDANGGIPRLFTPNSAFRGGLAMSGLHQDSTKAQGYTDAWLTTVSEVDDNDYYPGTLRLIYMLLMAQVFPKGC